MASSLPKQSHTRDIPDVVVAAITNYETLYDDYDKICDRNHQNYNTSIPALEKLTPVFSGAPYGTLSFSDETTMANSNGVSM